MRLLSLLGLLLCCSIALAQESIVLSELPGIRNKEDFVNEFFEDYKGMLWMKTANKLYRFTGATDERCDTSIARKFLIREAQYYDTSFFINYLNNSLVQFNIKTRKSIYIELPERLRSYPVFLAERDWFLVLATERKQLYRLRYATPGAQVMDSFSIPAKDIKYLGNETALINQNDSFYLLDLHSMHMQRFPYCESLLTVKFHHHELASMFEDRPYFYRLQKTPEGIFRLDIEHADLSRKYQYDAFTLQGYHFYKELGGNFYYFRDSLGNTRRFQFVNCDGVPFNFPFIYGAFIDAQQRFFISTERGIFYCDLKATSCINYYLVNGTREAGSLANLELRNAYYDAGTRQLYLGSRHKGVIIYTYDTLQKRFRYRSQFIPDKERNEGNTITHIEKDHSGQLWIHTNVTCSGPAKYKLDRITSSWHSIEDSTDFWFASSFSGFMRLNKKSGKVSTYDFDDRPEGKKFAWFVLEKDRSIYVCTHGGMHVFDIGRSTFDNPLNHTFSMLFKDEICWEQTPDFHHPSYSFVCTQGTGLYRVAYNGTNKTKLLPGVDEIYQCYSGPEGNLANSAHNLYYFGDGSNAFVRFEPGFYPLPGNLAFRGFGKAGPGQLCVCGNNAFSIIQLEKLGAYIHSIKPSFFIQDCEILNHQSFHYPEPGAHIRLGHQENNIRITVNSSCIGAVSQMNLLYVFEGESDTFRLFNTNEISFLNLAPGSYGLRIFAQAANGIWNEAPLLLSFQISPPWYAGITARSAYVLLLLLFAGSIFRFYKKQGEKKRSYAMLKLESELKSLRSQMNPHFMFNALNAIQQYVLSNDKENANIYLSKFAQLVRQTLDNTGKETLPLKEELNWLNNYLNLEKLRHAGKFEFIVEIAEGLQMDCEIPTMMIQPFVENAIVHGVFNASGNGLLRLAFSPHDARHLQCIVEDNGPGMDASRENALKAFSHMPRGLSITQQRMRYINEKYKTAGSISIGDAAPGEPQRGTRVSILLPFFAPDTFY